ncbi:unnamed protein product [Mytilus edulis]|uniref:Tc1-like transposase DDE domain-containing protein n=1 Tax=Mytilus edulis TaxID=6550 RepID=A0A8S3U6K4_MYTED|nr:unnamed protein product [Mytilus edulis]
MIELQIWQWSKPNLMKNQEVLQFVEIEINRIVKTRYKLKTVSFEKKWKCETTSYTFDKGCHKLDDMLDGEEYYCEEHATSHRYKNYWSGENQRNLVSSGSTLTKRKVLIEKDAIVKKQIEYLHRIKDYRKKAKASNQTPKCVIDNIARGREYEILRHPLYHPNLNPIEMKWNKVKQSVASRNVTHRIADVLKLVHEAVAEITVSDSEKTCRHVANIEEDYRKKDIVIEEQMERLIIDIADSSDSDGDNGDNV